MASKQDIITSIKNPDIFLKIPELKGAKTRLNPNGSPFAFTGGFNMVFQLLHHSKKWAFRVWHVPMGENKDRYLAISKYLTNSKLPYFADFIYDKNGLLVNGELTDTIRMEWLEGLLLKDYIEANLENKIKLETLAKDFLEMVKALRSEKISHGDLQEGNILVESSGKIKLVDYDSICIPEIEGESEIVTGLKGYQHPSRFKGSKASLKADYFSELVIFISILALAENNKLWNKYQVKNTQYLLFTETDFDNFYDSEIFQDLNLLSNSIKSLAKILGIYLNENSYLKLKPLETYITVPKIDHFTSNLGQILQNNETILNWKVENADSIIIDNQIGKVNSTGSTKVKPTKSTIYKVIAENFFGKAEQTINIEVLSQPKIIEFRSKQSKIKFGSNTQLVWNVENVKKIELCSPDNINIVSNREEKSINPAENTTYKLIITALDGIKKIEKEVSVQVFKKVEIKSFQTNFSFIVDSIPVTLHWSIDNASEIILEDNFGKKTDLTNKIEYKEYIKKDTTYQIRCKNDLFDAVSEKLTITSVQNKYDLEIKGIVPNLDYFVPDADKIVNLEFDFIPSLDYDKIIDIQTIDCNLSIDLSNGDIDSKIAKKISKPNNIKLIVDKIKSYIQP